MTTIWRRIQAALSGTTPGRRFQEEADVGVAAVLTCLRALTLQAENRERRRDELFQQAIKLMSKKSFEDQQKHVQDSITQQLESTFKALLLQESSIASSSPRMSLSGFTPERDPALKQYEGKDVLVQKLGYSLSVGPSSVPDAGRGVKLKGHVLPGTAVALYPGTVYMPEHFKRKKYLQEVSNNPYTRARFDSILINAKHEPPVPSHNCLAVGHMINHPPADRAPNVIPFSYDFPSEGQLVSESFQHLIPNRFVEEPSRLSMLGRRASMFGIVFIALTDIHEEELFLNYRYNPYFPLPDWYTPVDVESDRQMWK